MDLSGVSLASWTLALVNNAAWAAQGALAGDWWLTGTNAALAAVTVALIATVALR